MGSIWDLNTCFDMPQAGGLRRPSVHIKAKGFSLVELTVVLLLITLIASIAVRETSELSFQTRYEQTKERLEMIRQAILGNPRQIINGQQALSGFVADMGRLPANLRELIQRSGDCDNDAGDISQAACEAKGGAWTASAWNSNAVSQTDPASGLRYGWNGPYLSISGNPADSDALTDGWGRMAQGYCSELSYTTESSCISAAGVWTAAGNDFNFGWYVASASNELFIQSYGKNHVFGGSEVYDQDYPPFASQSAVKSRDWMVDVSGGVSVNFKKTNGTLPSDSYCSDPAKFTKSDCSSTGGSWHGGCNKAGYYNKDSCQSATSEWSPCSDGASTTKSACEAAGKEWYGEGFGCSNQANPLKTQCISPDVWRSCSDSGVITNESACLSADQIWYGDNIFNNSLSTQKICMRIYYRTSGSTIGELVSDDNLANDSPTVHIDPKSIVADGSFQSVRFANFRDEANNLLNMIPAGSNAIGIYQHDGTNCTAQIYPADRQMPIQMDFHARSGLPVINW